MVHKSLQVMLCFSFVRPVVNQNFQEFEYFWETMQQVPGMMSNDTYVKI